MQDYINNHAESEDFDFGEVYETAAYSRRHADRIFKELTGKTPPGVCHCSSLVKGCGKACCYHGQCLRNRPGQQFSVP